MRLRVETLCVVLVAGAVLLSGCAGIGGAPEPTPTVFVPIEAPRVVADGRIVPVEHAEIHFLNGGLVEAVLIEEGDTVADGEPLARLDTAELELAVEQARALLDQSTAAYEQLAAGATPEEIAAAEVLVAQAEAQATQVASGVSSSDIAAARAELEQARLALARIERGPKDTEITQARSALDQASADLQTQRDALATAKLDAEERVTQAANTLRDAQDTYSRIYWENRELERQIGDDDLPQAALDAEDAALRAVESAESALEQSNLNLERARQAEISGIASAEARVRDAQARLEQLLAGADDDEIAAARARVAAAQANLARLTGDERAAQIDVAESGIDQAAANLELVSAGPREVDLAMAEAQIRVNQVALRQAELALERATLYAPFAGTVVEVNLKPGELTPPEPAMVLADLSTWRIETSDLTELDIAAVSVGDNVTLTFDALPDLSLPGVVTRIKEIGTSFQGDVIYTVEVEPEGWDERLRWNMTATVTIEA
jgi:multidrug efflux pump subunit AcrA (membrane-fusion protein)